MSAFTRVSFFEILNDFDIVPFLSEFDRESFLLKSWDLDGEHLPRHYNSGENGSLAHCLGPRPPRTRDGKSNKKRKEEKEKGEKTCRKSPTGINPSSLVMNKKNIKDPTTSLFYSQIFTLEKVDEEYWGGTWYDFSISDPYVNKSLYRGEKIKGAC